jgi:hypothetical protein
MSGVEIETGQYNDTYPVIAIDVRQSMSSFMLSPFCLPFSFTLEHLVRVDL